MGRSRECQKQYIRPVLLCSDGFHKRLPFKETRHVYPKIDADNQIEELRAFEIIIVFFNDTKSMLL